MPLKMNNEQKLKIPPSIVSIACSALNTEIVTTTSTTTTPTTSAIQQTSAQKSSPSAASAASKSSLARASALSGGGGGVAGVAGAAAAGKNANLTGTHSSPMSDAAAAAAQETSNVAASAAADNTDAAIAALMKKDAPISTIANINNSANSSSVAASNSTPKVVATEATTSSNNNSNNNNNSSTSSSNNTNADKSKKTELWEGSGLKDWDDSSLKNLLEEAYSYKTPRDKENKSEYFLQLLQNAENEKEDQTFAFRAIASRYTRNSATSSASNSHKQGGSLQDLVEAVRNESLLDCDYQFGVGGQRNRRHNHNSRQKKYSSVSSRQREGGSLPSNVNVTYSGGSGVSALDQQTAPAFMQDVVVKNNNNNNNNNNSSNSNSGNSKQQQRRNKASERTIAASLALDKDCDSVAVFNSNSESGTASSLGAGTASGVVGAGGGCGAAAVGSSITAINCVSGVGGSSGDCVIEIGEPMMDIQQQQQILQAKGHDAATQALPFYERLENIDVRIPRANVISSIQTKTDFAPTSAQCYVDEAVRFTTLERGGVGAGAGVGSGSSSGSTGSGACHTACGQSKVSSTIDTKYLPLDENYKSCKSVLGEKTEMVKTPSTMFSTTKTITRQFDEEIYQQTAAAAIFNASTTGAHSSTISQSQAKAKNKKKSQQERNTKTVDVKSVAGYRGNDPVEVLVKYIESSEDKQNDKSTSNNNKFNENTKKRERKKEKEKQHKMKKSNSLEELRSCAKIDVDELKTSAATTESNVMMRNKSGKNKNNSASAADINKNYETKELTTASTTTTTTTSSGKALGATSPPTSGASGNNNQRKGERRSWGTEELQYLGESNSNEERSSQTKEKKSKEKNKETEIIKEKSNEKQDKNANSIDANNSSNSSTAIIGANGAAGKQEKAEKRKKSEGNLQAVNLNTLTTTSSSLLNEDIHAIDASLLPEAAEFHVVTKKKKPKKQRASLDETNSSSSYTNGSIGGFQRTTNFMYNMQKSNNYVNGPQRYKYYNQQATNNDYMHNYNNNAANNNNNQHVADKSRRKSTSSMPPSEKSDSSDLDSVHSLPIESTTTATTTGITKNKQRHKSTNVQTAAAATNKTTAAAATNCPAPISYADIARTNKEQQLTPTTLASTSVTGDKWPAVDYINNNIQPQSNVATASELDVNNVDSTAATTQNGVGVVNTTTIIKQKVKKTTSKPDFPELVATLCSPTSVNNATVAAQHETTKPTNVKQISYSQSLATVPAVPVIANNNDDLAGEILVKEKPEKRFVAAAAAANSETELTQLSLNSNIQTNFKSQPLQPQQQLLQKSKSVENESYNYNNSNSSYNGNNMDQQYPALEKTMKRHSTATVFVGSGLQNSNNLSTTKHEDYAANTVSTPPTLKNTSTVISPNSQHGGESFIATQPSAKKVKEKSPTQNMLPLSNESSPQSNSNAVTTTTTTVARKSKREKSTPQLNEVTPSKSTTTSTQTATAYVNNVSRSQSNAVTSVETNNKKSHYNNSTHSKTHSKPQSLSKHSSTSSAGGSTSSNAAAASTANRPAVIILNDDRSTGGYAASNDFTFGDFNEDELKFFDDEVVKSSAETMDDDENDFEDINGEEDVEAENNIAAAAELVTTGVSDIENRSYMPTNISSKQQQTARRKTSPVCQQNAQRICLNDSGTNFNTTSASSSSSTSDIGTCVLNNSAAHGDELCLLTGAETSSPNTSVLVGANQSSDSGIYTSNKTKNKTSTKNDVASTDVNSNSHGTDSTLTKTNATKKLNAYLTKSPEQSSFNTSASSVSSGSSATRNKQITPTDGSTTTTTSSRATIKQNSSSGSVSLQPPQQLETCNEIETAIIAAAKAAAAVETQQQQQQQTQHNFNSSSASSSFSSSSSVSNESKYSSYQSQQQHQQPQQNNYHRHHQQQQHQHQHHQHSHHHNHHHRHYSQQMEDAAESQQYARSRSNSSQRDAAAVATVVSNAQHKEMDFNFITPSMSSLHHNDIIIDFIGSAWEEVAKVTKFYDGQ